MQVEAPPAEVTKGLHAEITKGTSLRAVGVVEGQNDGGVKDEVMLRGGLMNQIQKGVELNEVGVVEGVNCGTPKKEAVARGGLMNEIAKGKDLKYIHDDRKNHRDAANPEIHK